MAKVKPKKTAQKSNQKLHRGVVSHKIVKHRDNNILKEVKSAKTLNAIARLELIKKGFDNHPKDVIKSPQRNKYGSFKAHFKSDSRVCKERKIRRSEIMAKTRGRGLRVRNTNWTPDSYIICRD